MAGEGFIASGEAPSAAGWLAALIHETSAAVGDAFAAAAAIAARDGLAGGNGGNGGNAFATLIHEETTMEEPLEEPNEGRGAERSGEEKLRGTAA